MPEFTHVLHVFDSPNPSDRGEKLYRETSGIYVGLRKDLVVIFGADPNKRKAHEFIDAGHASRFLEFEVPKIDLRDQGLEMEPSVHVENKNTGLIIMAGSGVQVPGVMTPLRH